jgi:hypothetical protein
MRMSAAMMEMGRSEGGNKVAVRDSGMSEYIGVPDV